MMQRSRANEIPDLIHRLGSRSKRRVDASRARLSIIGGSAVESLVEALEGDKNPIRARVMPLLAMIQDPRGRQALIAMLLDRNPRMRLIAVRCLARFPSADTVAALNRLLDRSRRESMRIAAVHSLVEQYSAGQDQAIRRVLDLLFDREEQPPVRLAAFSLLRTLRPNQQRSILKRLHEDPSDEIRSHAARYESGADRESEPEHAEIERLLLDLACDDYTVWNAAAGLLASFGGSAVKPLIGEIERRSDDPEFCTRAGMVLKSLGRRCNRDLGDALDRIDAPVALQLLVEVVGSIGEKSLIYRLKNLIERISPNDEDHSEPDGFDPMLRVRAKSHLELARIGSRVAIRDLRAAFSTPQPSVELEMLTAMRLIGKREELALLLRAYDRTDSYLQGRIADAVRAIMKRERIRRNSRVLRVLSPEQSNSLAAILPRARPRSPRRRPGP